MDPDPAESIDPIDDAPTPAHAFRELRPSRRLRLWQIIPIVCVVVLGSLMFAFPLAFNSGASDLLVAVSGLLVALGAGCWGGLAAYRAGLSWPGLQRREPNPRHRVRALLGYFLLFAAAAALVALRLVALR
jgi:hypothetical protein